jgi:hypothetical protein
MQLTSWALWAAVLFFQNISFTYVSRARSSGSLLRHTKASVFSNGIWIFSNMLMLGPMFDYLTGKHGHGQQLASGVVYTVACVSGSIFAHYWALRTEKGKEAVGYNKKYAQIPVEEYARLQALISHYEANVKDEFGRVKGMAENAYSIMVGSMPDAKIAAVKVAGQAVTTGVPDGTGAVKATA